MDNPKTFTVILGMFIQWHGVPAGSATALANRIVREELGAMKPADWDLFLSGEPERAGDRQHWNVIRELVMGCYATATQRAHDWLDAEEDD